MKKTIALLLAFTLLFALSAACCTAAASGSVDHEKQGLSDGLRKGVGKEAGSGESEADAPLARLYLEKNGLPLDLTLQDLALEDGKLVVSIGIDQIAGWKEETPPKLIIAFAEKNRKFTLDLFSSDTVKSLPDSVKNYKMSTKLPYEGTVLPDRILIDIGEAEPLVFWENTGEEDEDAAISGAQDEAAAQDAVAEAKKLLDAGDYYEAALAVDNCRFNYPETGEECDALWDEIVKALEPKRPETGKLIRTMQYEGRNELRLHAAAGDLEVIATDIKTKEYARYYIRKGDSTTIYLPRGEYSLEINIGDLWFDDVTGFGTFGVPVTVSGTLDMASSSDGSWSSFTWYEYTI